MTERKCETCEFFFPMFNLQGQGDGAGHCLINEPIGQLVYKVQDADLRVNRPITHKMLRCSKYTPKDKPNE